MLLLRHQIVSHLDRTMILCRSHFFCIFYGLALISWIGLSPFFSLCTFQHLFIVYCIVYAFLFVSFCSCRRVSLCRDCDSESCVSDVWAANPLHSVLVLVSLGLAPHIHWCDFPSNVWWGLVTNVANRKSPVLLRRLEKLPWNCQTSRLHILHHLAILT